jgi:capsular exopolysaccharide synthesis family protein
MSNIYKALQQAELENTGTSELTDATQLAPNLLQVVPDEHSWLEHVPSVRPVPLAENRIVTISDCDSLGAEKFRLLRTRLRHLQDRSELKKIVITSGAPGEGKTTVASNLAISLARHTSQKVLLLEGDLRHPALAGKFGLRGLRGLREWFDAEETLTQFIYRVEGYQLWFLPCGSPAEDAVRILQSNRFQEAMTRLSGCFDWIVIDAPPLTPLADIHLWADKADGVLLVVREGLTPKKTLLKGLTALDGAKLLGVVLNDVPGLGRDYDEHYNENGNGKKGNRPIGE